MRERLVVAAILTFGPYLTLWASAPQQVDEAKARHLQLKSTPKCTEDPEDATLSEALNWARSDLAIKDYCIKNGMMFLEVSDATSRIGGLAGRSTASSAGTLGRRVVAQ